MIAVVVLGQRALPVAKRVQAALADARLHGLARRVEAEVAFDDAASHLRRLFEAGETIVGICAAGILVRSLAPLLRDKMTEPPVLAVAEDGSTVVPLLGGHHGANELARTIASSLGVAAAITTAGDLHRTAALDEPPPGFRLADASAAKSVMAAALAGEPVDVILEAAAAACDWLAQLPRQAGGKRRIRVTDRAAPPRQDELVIHPATLAVGVGCERGASTDELHGLVDRCLREQGLARESVAGLFSIGLKAAEPAIHAVARELDVAARFFDETALLAETARLTEKSDIVFRETGCWGVAEGAALAAVGSEGRLVVPKTRSQRATCAIAQSPRPIDAAALGQARGRLAIVGIGPGGAEARTAEVERAVAAATDLVGYGLYLDLLGRLGQGKRRHAFALGEEDARVRHALTLAAAGRQVALVSSGDAGIYAMSSLVFEALERSGDAGWHRVEIVGLPGVSAMQTAAARVGAPLGHDFCAISLSDLLTPWPTVRRRLQAAAAGDFVVALYNPVSQRRRTQLAEARDILLRARPGSTPVVIARNLGRAGETVRTTSLDALDPAEVDMLSIVLVGSSETRRVARPDGGEWVYTPRGYGHRAGDSA